MQTDGPVPAEHIGIDADGCHIDTRSGVRLEARGAIRRLATFNAGIVPTVMWQGQGWYPIRSTL